MDAPHDDPRLTAFAAAVRASPHNLLSQRALDELETRHIAESVSFAASLSAEHGPRVLDLGTGGGFPGMVIALTRPDLQVTLLDATAKKIAFLRAFADEHQVAVATLRGRAEDLQRQHRGRFDHVTARAVAPLDRLIPWALPFLRPGGLLHAIKGESWAEELRAALPMIKRYRAQIVDLPADSTEQESVPASHPRVVMLRAAG